MFNISRYYKWAAHFYGIEFDASGQAQGGYVLQSDGSWRPIIRGWQAIVNNGLPISEDEAYLLAGIKKRPVAV